MKQLWSILLETVEIFSWLFIITVALYGAVDAILDWAKEVSCASSKLQKKGKS